MDRRLVRYQKLLELIRQEGSQAAVAIKGGTDRSYLSQIVSANGNRHVGTRLARKLEKAFGKPEGWMDQTTTTSFPLTTCRDHALTSDYSLIPRYDAQASMGQGSPTTEQDDLIGYLAFKNVWLEKRRLNPQYLTIIDAIGDSMHPTICDGDVLLVDLRQKEPVDNKIFILRMNNQLYAKRLQMRPGNRVMVCSDNPLASPFDVNVAEQQGLDIIGRVVWAGKNF